jgi:hypothetical protein
MKKIKNIVALLVLGFLVISPFGVSLSHAEDGGGNRDQEIKSGNNNEGGKEVEQDDNEDGQTNSEHDIASFLSSDLQNMTSVSLPEVHESSIVTYADVVNILKSYDAALLQISANAGVNTDSSKLSVAEKSLLDSLLNKHHNQFDRFDNRVNEAKAQLKQLEDLLTPLGTQPISTLYDIKGLLISELNNYRDIINGISEFDNLNLQTLQRETD